MTDKQQVSATAFQQNPGRYQNMALANPLEITKHGRPTLIMMSISEYHKITENSRRVMGINELSAEDIDTIIESEMSPKYDYLNEELEDD